MNDWNIQSRAHQCQACGRSFADKEAYHTLLFDEKKDFLRLDVCEACWKGQYSEGANERKGFISYWQGVYEAPPPAPPEAIKKETAETLLRKIMEKNETKFAAASFILAVMLERKRLLKVKEQIHSEGRRVFIYEHPATGDIFTIPDPQLQLNQLEEVQRDVGDLLANGFPEETPPAPPATETATVPAVAPDENAVAAAAGEASPPGDAGTPPAPAQPA